MAFLINEATVDRRGWLEEELALETVSLLGRLEDETTVTGQAAMDGFESETPCTVLGKFDGDLEGPILAGLHGKGAMRGFHEGAGQSGARTHREVIVRG